MGAFVRNPLCDPTDLDGDAESLAYKRMSAKENLPGFERVSFYWNFLMSNAFGYVWK